MSMHSIDILVSKKCTSVSLNLRQNLLTLLLKIVDGILVAGIWQRLKVKFDRIGFWVHFYEERSVFIFFLFPFCNIGRLSTSGVAVARTCRLSHFWEVEENNNVKLKHLFNCFRQLFLLHWILALRKRIPVLNKLFFKEVNLRVLDF